MQKKKSDVGVFYRIFIFFPRRFGTSHHLLRCFLIVRKPLFLNAVAGDLAHSLHVMVSLDLVLNRMAHLSPAGYARGFQRLPMLHTNHDLNLPFDITLMLFGIPHDA